MGNFMGMPSSTQVSFPPAPYPMPVSRPPIIPPMRQLDIGLGPPSPFEPGRTPMPVLLPSLATRPPLVQPDGMAIVSNVHPIPPGLTVQAPMDKIIISNQMNKNPVLGIQQQQGFIVADNTQTNLQQINMNNFEAQPQIQKQSVQYHAPNQIQMMNDATVPTQFIQKMIVQPQNPVQDPRFFPQMINQNQFASDYSNQQTYQYPIEPPLQIQEQQFVNPFQQLPQQHIHSQPNQIGIMQPSTQYIESQNFMNPIIDSNAFVPLIPSIVNLSKNNSLQYNQQSIQEKPPHPHPTYASPVDSVPIIPTRILETVNQIKQSREFLDNQRQRGTALSPYYIPSKQAYYEGEWINGLPGGYARIFYDSGAYFKGHFVNGQAFCKEGVWIYPDGSYYIGGIAHSAPNGLGQLIYKGKGMKYIGNWMDGKPHGQGREQFQDGSFFEGTFVHGIKDGVGKFIWSDGSFYQGQFKDGFMQGRGIKQFSNGSKFIGEFRKNKLYGRGTFISQKGQYKGQFINNQRQGVGTFKYPDGRIYTGQFLMDKQQGRGKMLVPTGQLIDGEWINGKNVAIHNVSQSTSIDEVSLQDLNLSVNRMQIPNVPMTVSLQAMDPTQFSPNFPAVTNSNMGSGSIQPPTNFYYSANYRPTQQSHIRWNPSQIHQ